MTPLQSKGAIPGVPCSSWLANSNMNSKELSEALSSLDDRDLLFVLQSALENRKPQWSEATDEYGWPTRAATLAMLRKILCG